MRNPYNYHAPVRTDAMFFGRDELVTDLVRGLNEPIPISAAVLAGRRCGKTSLLNRLMRVLRSDDQGAGERSFIACYLDLQGSPPLASAGDFFLWVLEEAANVWEAQTGLERYSIALPASKLYHERLTRGPVDAFAHGFRSILRHGRSIRLVVLLDESDRLLAADWGHDLRSNLRALLSNSEIAEHMALVMVGSTRMHIILNERDSPLENILDRHGLTTLSHEATTALALSPCETHVPPEVLDEVWRQTGGHPCLSQYALHELWEALNGHMEEATIQKVQTIASTFEDRTRHFSSWAKAVGQLGNALYDLLAHQDGSVTFAFVRAWFPEVPGHELRSALDMLAYHGLLHYSGQGAAREYRIAGLMYKNWFEQLEISEQRQPSFANKASGKRRRLEAELTELQAKYDTLSQRIAARDKEIGRTLDLVRKQILEEERADWAKERERIAAQMTEIEATLSH